MKLDLAGYYLAGGGASGGGGPEVESLSVTENGTYSEEGKAYSPVTVNVPIPTLETKSITANGNYDAPSGRAYNRVEVNVAAVSKLQQVLDGSVTELTADDMAGITSLTESALSKRGYLLSVVIPAGVERIGPECFSRCVKLESVSLPEGIKLINSSAFERCYALERITIPSSITDIKGNAFYYCNHLTSVTVEATTPPVLGNVNAFQQTPNELVIYVPAASVDTYKAATNWSNYSDKIQAIPS